MGFEDEFARRQEQRRRDRSDTPTESNTPRHPELDSGSRAAEGDDGVGADDGALSTDGGDETPWVPDQVRNDEVGGVTPPTDNTPRHPELDSGSRAAEGGDGAGADEGALSTDGDGETPWVPDQVRNDEHGGVDGDPPTESNTPRHPELDSGSRAAEGDGGVGADEGALSTGGGDETPWVPDQARNDEVGGVDGDPPTESNTPHPQQQLSLPPGYRPRAGGWSKGKMRAFLEALVETASVSDAAKAVHMSRQSAYRLRARLTGTPFDLAWEAAFEFGLRQLSHAALDRAVNGTTEPVFHGGEQIGEKRVYHDVLTRFLLANPARLGRAPIAREHGLLNWDGILDRVEHGELDWSRPDRDAADAPEAEALAQDYIAQQSEYGAQWVWELEKYKARKEMEKSSGSGGRKKW